MLIDHCKAPLEIEMDMLVMGACYQVEALIACYGHDKAEIKYKAVFDRLQLVDIAIEMIYS